jgi:hypothetical protein
VKRVALAGVGIALIGIAAHERSTVNVSKSGAPVFETQSQESGNQNCCNCDPTASDQACFAQCNAMLPRCRPAAQRPASPPPKQTMTYYCCYYGAYRLRYRIQVPVPLGAHCGNWGPLWAGCQ